MKPILNHHFFPFLLIWLISASIGCSDQGFQANNALKQGSSDDDQLAIDGDLSQDQQQDDEISASEPVMVGGAFLGCFVDHSAMPGETSDARAYPVGCSVFSDQDYQERVPEPGFEIVKATLNNSSSASDVIQFRRQADHPRWTWLALIPSQGLSAGLRLTLQSPDGREQIIDLSIADLIPPSMIGHGLTPVAEFKFRMPGTDLCMGGDPLWSGEGGNFDTEAVALVPCSEALSFQLSPWLDGYRMHTRFPATFACEPQWFDQNFCDRACVDLIDFGRGDDFVLFACTYSEEAQIMRLNQVESLAVEIAANGRYMKLDDDNDLQAAQSGETRASFQIISSPSIGSP